MSKLGIFCAGLVLVPQLVSAALTMNCSNDNSVLTVTMDDSNQVSASVYEGKLEKLSYRTQSKEAIAQGIADNRRHIFFLGEEKDEIQTHLELVFDNSNNFLTVQHTSANWNGMDLYSNFQPNECSGDVKKLVAKVNEVLSTEQKIPSVMTSAGSYFTEHHPEIVKYEKGTDVHLLEDASGTGGCKVGEIYLKDGDAFVITDNCDSDVDNGKHALIDTRDMIDQPTVRYSPANTQ